jgi:hypothetical protein
MQNKIRNIFRYMKINSAGRIVVNGVPTKFVFTYWTPTAPATAVVDRYVTVTNMIVGAYAVANANPGDGLDRNITVAVTADGAADTMGTILITGTDHNGEVITETITPVVNTTVSGIKAFKTVTNVVGAGWVTNGNEDDITVGFGDVVGFPVKMVDQEVYKVIWNQAIATPTMKYSPEISKCTLALTTAADATKKLLVVYLKEV